MTPAAVGAHRLHYHGPAPHPATPAPASHLAQQSGMPALKTKDTHRADHCSQTPVDRTEDHDGATPDTEGCPLPPHSAARQSAPGRPSGGYGIAALRLAGDYAPGHLAASPPARRQPDQPPVPRDWFAEQSTCVAPTSQTLAHA